LPAHTFQVAWLVWLTGVTTTEFSNATSVVAAK